MKKGLSSILLLAFVYSAQADMADTISTDRGKKFRVYVMDKKTKTPLAGAEIKFTNLRDSSTQRLFTDKSGVAEFNRFDSANYRIESTYTGDTLKRYFITTATLSAKSVRQSDTIALEQMIICRLHYRIENVYFDYDKMSIRPDAAKELDKLIRIMKDNPTMEIEVFGHSDCRGSKEGNMAASLKRAKAVVEYLVKEGISEKRLLISAWGDTKPVNSCNCQLEQSKNCDENYYQENRRVEFKFLKM